MRRLHWLAGLMQLGVALASAIAVGITAAPAPVALIPVDGEAANYWTRWRGPSGQGLVAGTGYVDTWSDTANVKWRAEVPGRGHSSPIVWKDWIFLTTARDGGTKLSMLAYRRRDGQLLLSILTVVEARTGAPVYQERLGQAMREGFSSSPVAVGDTIFFTNDLGQTFVVQAGRTFNLLRVNELNAQVLASPALVDGTWYWRTDRALLAIGR